MSSETLRWMWFLVGLAGTMGAIGATAVMSWLARDAIRYAVALQSIKSPSPALALVQNQTNGEAWDMRMLVASVATLLVAVASATGAGAAAIFAEPQLAIGLLVLEEVCLVLGVVMLLVLGLGKLDRRNRTTAAVRKTRLTDGPQ